MIETLAATQHEIWAHWQRYLHSKCIELPDGSLAIPADLVEHWNRQIETPYDALTEKEKDSDREQARKIMGAFRVQCKGDGGDAVVYGEPVCEVKVHRELKRRYDGGLMLCRWQAFKEDPVDDMFLTWGDVPLVISSLIHAYTDKLMGENDAIS